MAEVAEMFSGGFGRLSSLPRGEAAVEVGCVKEEGKGRIDDGGAMRRSQILRPKAQISSHDLAPGSRP